MHFCAEVSMLAGQGIGLGVVLRDFLETGVAKVAKERGAQHGGEFEVRAEPPHQGECAIGGLGMQPGLEPMLAEVLLACEDIAAEQALLAQLLGHCDSLFNVGLPGAVDRTLAGAHCERRQQLTALHTGLLANRCQPAVAEFLGLLHAIGPRVPVGEVPADTGDCLSVIQAFEHREGLQPVPGRVIPVVKPAPGQATLVENPGALVFAEVGVQFQGLVVILHRFAGGRRCQGKAPGLDQQTAGSAGISQWASVVKMPGDIRRVAVARATRGLHGVGQLQVKALPARRGQPLQQGLPHQSVRELVVVGA